MQLLPCSFCNKECKNKNGLAVHQRMCKENPNRKDSYFVEYHKKGFIPWNKGKTGVQEAWNKGLPAVNLGTTHTEATKAKMSKIKRALYDSGWESNAGRCKKYDYSSPIAGEIKVDGTWELIFCKYADANNLKWSRNKKRFPYINQNGKYSTYQPDFYVEEWNCFVEVKGYETDQDRAKWRDFPEPIKILRKAEIDMIKNNTFDCGRISLWTNNI